MQISFPSPIHVVIVVTRPTAELAYPVQPRDSCAAWGYFPRHFAIGQSRLLYKCYLKGNTSGKLLVVLPW